MLCIIHGIWNIKLLDIMAYITNKTANHEDPTLDDAKVKGILTGKSYIKTANNTSFTTVKGEL